MDTADEQHLDQHLNTDDIDLTTTDDLPSSTSRRITRAKQKSLPTIDTSSPHQGSTSSKPARGSRRSARIPVTGSADLATPIADSKGKKKVQIETEEQSARSKRSRAPLSSPLTPPIQSTLISDLKGKKRALPSPSPDSSDLSSLDSESETGDPPSKRPRKRYELRSKAEEASETKGKGKAKAVGKGKKSAKKMPKKINPKQKRSGVASPAERTKKGDTASKQLLDDDDPMNDDSQWVDEPGSSNAGAMVMAEEEPEDENMGGSGHDDEDEEHSDEDEDEEGMTLGAGAGQGSNPYDRLARLAGASGMHIDEATAAALFGGDFRSFGGMMSGLSTRFKGLKAQLKSKSSVTRLAALRECSELLLVSNEDTLGGAFSTTSFATEFIAILKGKPNIDEKGGDEPEPVRQMDEDAQLAAALAMSTGGTMPSGFGLPEEDEMECQLVACRCLAHLMEALPGSGHTLVHLGAVPVLCSKLMEISYIELAEQTLSTMEKISAEYPAAIVREGGLGALLNYLPFFSTNVQRTAVTAAANCCKNLSSEHYTQIRDVFPILRETLTQADQRLVEQATLAVVRTIEAYRHRSDHLEGLLDVPTVVAVNSLLMPSGGSPLLTPSTYTHLLKALTTSARGSAKVTIAFLEAGMTNTIYQILTGVLPSTTGDNEQGEGEGGQGLAGGVADMAVLQNLAHRPKDQVEESLALICELLPPTPRDGVFDPRSYTEKALAKIKKGRNPEQRSDKPSRRSSRHAANTPGESTPGVGGEPSTPLAGASALPAVDSEPTPGPSNTVKDSMLKAKKDAEAQMEERVELLKAQPELVGKFIKAIVPVLVDVYAASVALRVRTKVLMGLVKAIAFAEQGGLTSTLKTVPMASFLCAIIATKDNPIFVVQALQLVELLAVKLPEVYQTSFQREGVVFEIDALAEQELSTAKASDNETPVVKTEPEEVVQATPTPAAGPSTSTSATTVLRNISDDLKPLFAASGLPGGLSSFLAESGLLQSTSTPTRPSSINPADGNISRARVLVAKKIFNAGGDSKDAASLVLEELSALVKRLCVREATERELRDALGEIASKFSDVGQALSSFELLKSGLVDGLLDFVDIDGTVIAGIRRNLLFEVFSDTISSPTSPLSMLVKRLHESLSRLESYEVEIAYSGMADSGRPSSSSLSRTMRIRLQAEEGQDIPKQVSNLSLTIQAIAPMQAVHEYMRPRVADPNYMASSGMSGMFAAYAAGMPTRGGGVGGGGSGSASASRFLAALNANRPGGVPSLGAPIASSAPESSRLAIPPPSGSETGAKSASQPQPTRRRSARISGQGVRDAEAEEEELPAMDGIGDAGSSELLSSSAPEPSILPAMPLGMGMDFDEDDGYSDEEFDADVFEDEMEEEIMRPAEKVVNMSLAPDGSRVEAKTPDGTRVRTPSQGGPAAPNAGSATGTDTPRTASYAGAVKAPPLDWHLEFTLNGKVVPLTDTVYGVVHRNRQAGDQTGGAASYGGVFGMPVIFKFRKVDGPLPSSKVPIDAPTPGSVASEFPTTLEAGTPTAQILRLLRVVHNLVVDERETSGRGDTQLDEKLFINNKLTAKLTRQLEETMIIASDCLPDWAVDLPKHFSFLFSFETRYAFLQSTSFGTGRLIAKYQAAQSAANRSSNRRDDFAQMARIPRQKVRISRSQLLESAAKVLELYGTGHGILEVEYFDEVGTGLGPTLEFYSLVSREFGKKALRLWRDDDEGKGGEFVYTQKGWYPSPAKEGEDAASVTGSRMSWYKSLGLFVGRALLDSRLIDVNLNKVFLKLILGKPVKKTIATLKHVDAVLARSLERLQGYLSARKEIEALTLPASTRRSKLAGLNVGGAKLQDLSLDFTLPGYDIELKPNGKHIDVDDNNIEEYLEKVLDLTLGSGVVQQAKAFQEGFSMIFSIEDLKIFSPEELGLLFGNAEEDWSREALEHAIKADHGYNLDSRAVQNLIEVLSSYGKEQRRAFLQFTTGAPKLPIGGFRGLTPPFTVVRKPHESPYKADDYLPSVMTCAQYLKMPDYSTKEVLATQIKRAIEEGGGSFHLS